MFLNRFPSTERSVPKDGVRNPRGSAERLRGAAVSSQKTTASRDGGLAQNPVQRGRFAEGACNRTPEHDARTAEHDGSTNPHGRGRCPRNGESLRNNGTSGSVPRRSLQMSLGWRPRAETPGSQSAQKRPILLGSDALASCESQTHVYNDTNRPSSPPGYRKQLF